MVSVWSPTKAELDDAGDDDDDERCHLGVGEDILDPGAPLHIRRVDECQQALTNQRKERGISVKNMHLTFHCSSG